LLETSYKVGWGKKEMVGVDVSGGIREGKFHFALVTQGGGGLEPKKRDIWDGLVVGRYGDILRRGGGRWSKGEPQTKN